jgi:hypothetical protein
VLGLDRPDLDHELQKMQFCVRNVYITRQWFAHGFSISLQECLDAIENLVELCRVLQRLLADPALLPDFEACVSQLKACLAAVDDVQSEVSEHGAASLGLRVEHVAVVVLLRSFERFCAAAEQDTRLLNPTSECYDKNKCCMRYVDVTDVIKDMKNPPPLFKMSSALIPFCHFVETGRNQLFHGTESGAALSFFFCAGAVMSLLSSLGAVGQVRASETADELLFALSLSLVRDEESLLTNIAQSQSKRPAHPVGEDLTWMHCLLLKNADFQLHSSMSKFDSKNYPINLFISEFGHVKKAKKLKLPAPDTPENRLKRCSVLVAGIVMSSLSLHAACEAHGGVATNVTAGFF